jgi:hypothetical protein
MNSDGKEETHHQLSEREAFQAMVLFVNRYAYAAEGNDIVGLMSESFIESDGGPTDPALWDEWLDCVRQVKTDQPPGSG